MLLKFLALLLASDWLNSKIWSSETWGEFFMLLRYRTLIPLLKNRAQHPPFKSTATPPSSWTNDLMFVKTPAVGRCSPLISRKFAIRNRPQPKARGREGHSFCNSGKMGRNQKNEKKATRRRVREEAFTKNHSRSSMWFHSIRAAEKHQLWG